MAPRHLQEEAQSAGTYDYHKIASSESWREHVCQVMFKRNRSKWKMGRVTGLAIRGWNIGVGTAFFLPIVVKCSSAKESQGILVTHGCNRAWVLYLGSREKYWEMLVDKSECEMP